MTHHQAHPGLSFEYDPCQGPQSTTQPSDQLVFSSNGKRSLHMDPQAHKEASNITSIWQKIEPLHMTNGDTIQKNMAGPTYRRGVGRPPLVGSQVSWLSIDLSMLPMCWFHCCHPSEVVWRSVHPKVERHGAHGSLTWHPLSFPYKTRLPLPMKIISNHPISMSSSLQYSYLGRSRSKSSSSQSRLRVRVKLSKARGLRSRLLESLVQLLYLFSIVRLFLC